MAGFLLANLRQTLILISIPDRLYYLPTDFINYNHYVLVFLHLFQT